MIQKKARRRTERNLIQKEQSELQERIASTVRVRAPRDPSRLMKATMSRQSRLITMSQERDEKDKAIQVRENPSAGDQASVELCPWLDNFVLA